MDRRELLTALTEAEKNADQHCIEMVEIAKALGSPLFDILYDPRNDAPVQPPPPRRRKRPGAIRYGKRKRKQSE